MSSLCLGLAVALCATAATRAASDDPPVATAAMRGDLAEVQTLLKQGADVNAPQNDGMTALHWAALNGNVAMARMLLYAGADVDAATRIGGYTPLDIAAKDGHAALVEALLKGGANAKQTDAYGTTPLMLAAASGDLQSVTDLLNAGADVNAREHIKGETPLMFAAAFGRVRVIQALLAHGADWKPTTRILDWTKLPKNDPRLPHFGPPPSAAKGLKGKGKAKAAPHKPADAGGHGFGGPAVVAAANRSGLGLSAAQGGRGFARPLSYTQLVGTQGGLSALMFAVRQGHLRAVQAFVQAGVNVNEVDPGDHSSPLLVATVNGQFDIARYLLDHGADPNLASVAGATPLYTTINVQWAPHAFYPQPDPYQQHTSYLQLMQDLLAHGANPNARLKRALWYTGYNFDQSGVDPTGATPFWRAAQSTDLKAMKLLLAHGADPKIWSKVTPSRPLPNGANQQNGLSKAQLLKRKEARAKLVGEPAVSPFLVAAGAGWDGNFNVNAPGSWMPAIRYFVEKLHVNVNQRDYKGYTALHYAAARGDDQMILYLVSKGANPKAVANDGMTTADMANGPKQRINPFPKTIALLEGLGAKLMHKCISCGG
ncbi:MAG TPA: ankyrin repeat domain-containing protein [Vicinamibacterales bacterium]|nr:ankyrin repeat domain-containing protein [Vicinamibacterales bacterium]